MRGDDGIIRHMLEELVGSISKHALQLASAALAEAPAFPGLPRTEPIITGGGLNTCTITMTKAELLLVALLASLEIDITARTFIIMIQGALLSSTPQLSGIPHGDANLGRSLIHRVPGAFATESLS